MSPASRGIISGLVFAVVAAITVLGLNAGWLLPGTDETGVAYLTATPMIVAGVEPALPWADWDAPEPQSSLRDSGTGVPLVMAALMRLRPQPFVVGLWTIAASAALLLLAVGWVAGGVAGIPGAVLACAVIVVSGPSVPLILALRPELLAMAAVALQLGLMTYRPSGYGAQGSAAALAWLCHPAAVGAVAAALAWPVLRAHGRDRLPGLAAALAPPVLLLASAPVASGLFVPSLAVSGAGAGEVLADGLRWAGAGVGGLAGLAVGVFVAIGALVVVLVEAAGSPEAPDDVHWSDPRAHDALAEPFRPAALLLAFLLVLTGIAGLGPVGDLGVSWAPAVVPLVLLVSAAVSRLLRRQTPGRGMLALAACVAVWFTGTTITTGSQVAWVLAEGHGFTSRVWVESEVIRWVDNRSAGLGPIYSSQPELLVIQSGRGSRRLPTTAEGLDRFLAAWTERPGPIVLTWNRSSAFTARDFIDRLPVEEVVATPEGSVLIPGS